MSPYEIKLLLDIYCLPRWNEGRNEPILQETLDEFYDSGLIDEVKRITAKGRAHVIQLCKLLYPLEQKFWVDQFGNKIPDTI